MARSRRTSRKTVPFVPSDYDLEDFFTDDDLYGLYLRVRHQVIRAFHHATEMHRGRKKGTDNYIRGVEPKMSELARYVLNWMKDPFIKPADLIELIDVDEVPARQLNALIQQFQFEILMEVLHVMCVQPPKTPRQFRSEVNSQEIWYDPERCYWQILQSSVDEVRHNRKAFQQFRDNRNYHGRVRAQSRARGVPEGVSVSLA